jgi:NCS2 family nucleobase:cation symporter-2
LGRTAGFRLSLARLWSGGPTRTPEAGDTARKKPANLIYSVDEDPPFLATLVLALQHVFVISVGWIFVVVLVNGIVGTPEQSQSIIRISMIASGLATILQARTKGPVGAGYLCPFSCGPAYLAASILAGKAGGLPMVFGLTTTSGVFEGMLSRVIQRLRALFPPEVTGLVVSMVGIELIGLGCPRFLGYTSRDSLPDVRATVVALITLVAMVAPTVWSKGKLRLYPVFLGLSAGYIAAVGLDLFTWSHLHQILAAPLLSWPGRVPGGGWAFSIVFLVPFLIASLSSVLKTVGDLTLCQKINDANWKRTDMKSVSGGILAGSLGTTFAGLLGGVGQSTFSSNVGLSMATGATSRAIALPTGLFLIALAFFPRLAAVFAVMPAPVMGAVLVYVACFMILGGFQVMTSRMLDARKTFVVGIALIFGLSVEMVPGLYRNVPAAFQPLFASALSLATVLVVALNLLFRIGVAKSRRLELSPGPDNLDTISRFMEEQGAEWGMQKEVVSRATDALYEFMTNANGLQLRSPVVAQICFDEFNLEIDLDYDGLPMNLPVAPPPADVLRNGEGAVALLSGYIIRQYADRVSVTRRNDHCRVHLHFDH